MIKFNQSKGERMRHLAILLALVLLPSSAWSATGDFIKCGDTRQSPTLEKLDDEPLVMPKNHCVAYESTASVDSNMIVLVDQRNTICFIPNTAADSSGAGRGWVNQCVKSDVTEGNRVNKCERVYYEMDGQPPCLYGFEPGAYFLEMSTDAGGVTSRFTIEGHPLP